jgi:hypothetical protein
MGHHHDRHEDNWLSVARFHGLREWGAFERRTPSRQRLPEFHAVAIAVLDPGELSIALIAWRGSSPKY